MSMQTWDINELRPHGLPLLFSYDQANIKNGTTFFTTGNILGVTATLVICFSMLMIFVVCAAHTLKKKLKIHTRGSQLRDVQIVNGGGNIVIIPVTSESPPSYEQALSSPKLVKRDSCDDTLKIEDDSILPSYDEASKNLFGNSRRFLNNLISNATSRFSLATTTMSNNSIIIPRAPFSASNLRALVSDDEIATSPSLTTTTNTINSNKTAVVGGEEGAEVFEGLAEGINSNEEILSQVPSERFSTSSFPLCNYQYKSFVRKHRKIVEQLMKDKSISTSNAS